MADRYNTNNVTLTGRLTRDPKLQYKGEDDPRPDQTVWTILPLAVNKRTAEGTRVIYEDVKVWNGGARACVENLNKGSFVAVEGSLDQYDKPESGGRWHFIDAGNVEFIDGRRKEDGDS